MPRVLIRNRSNTGMKSTKEFAACLEKWSECNDSAEEIRLFNRLGRLEMLESALKRRQFKRA